ncbi:MAG: transcription elongation factor GreA [Thiovulaceae bacterium]|nr:transcription elongation factor GreA [Sulfurimonadaceae bacterium]
MQIEPITPEGYDLLTKEFRYLKAVEKPKVSREKEVAAAMGDRSENADYHAAKEKLRHIDKRLFYLNSLLQKTQIIDPSLLNHTRAHFGSTVTLLNLDSDEIEVYTICGVYESEPENGLISIHAPMAKKMMGRCAGDEFTIALSSGKKEYEVEKLAYIPVFELKKTIKDEKDFGFR